MDLFAINQAIGENIDTEILVGTDITVQECLLKSFDYLKSGGLSIIFDDFEGVQREQVIKVLEMSEHLIQKKSNEFHEYLA
jgi:hypothetical protein